MSTYQTIRDKFLSDHEVAIEALGLGPEDISAKMRVPFENVKLWTQENLTLWESKNSRQLPKSMEDFLTEVGSFDLYDHSVFSPERYSERMGSMRSWIESDVFNPNESGHSFPVETFLCFAGYASDNFLIHQTTEDVYFWTHDESELISRVGKLDEWFEIFLKDRLKKVKAYWLG